MRSNINEPISYNWKLGWENIPEKKPIVNRLLKEILEKNISKMNILYEQGALLKACDSITLSRVVFHVIDDYSVMNWLVEHGFSRVGQDIDSHGNNGINDQECISPYGYKWGLIGRTYYLKAYDVMNLLCSHGFSDFTCYDKGWDETWHADREILSTSDEKALKILLENGYVFKHRKYYEEYVLYRPQIKRKTIGLDPYKFSDEIPLPTYEKVPLFFGRKDAELRNKRRKEDYEDRVRAYKEFKNSFKGNYYELLDKKKCYEKIMEQAMDDILKRI